MWYIVLLIILGMLFLVAELLLFPGLSIGGILAMACYGGAIWYAFDSLGVAPGVWTVVAVAALSLLTLIFSLRAKTWQRLALKQEIDSVSMPNPESEVVIGAVGVSISRLSPMGKVEVNGKTFEAKSADVFIDQRSKVEVVGFDNFTLIVRKID
jgi:membrane-bound ClpP family serine protease